MSIFNDAQAVSIDGKDVLKIEIDGVTVWEKVVEIIPTKIHLTLTSTLKQQISCIYSGSGESTGATVRTLQHSPAPQRAIFNTHILRLATTSSK